MTSHNYLPPWREIRPDGTLGPEYGPKTAATFARQVADSRNWAHVEQRAPLSDAEDIRAYMRANGEQASEREREVFSAMYLSGLGLKRAAECLGVTRNSIKSYRARLRAKASHWRGEVAGAVDTDPQKGQE